MKRLSRYEEILIIRAAKENGEFLDNGSSRAVYDIGNGRVLKIAIDRKGQYQNKTEIELYRYSDSREYLAAVYAYGKFSVIMEKVVPVEYEDVRSLAHDCGYFNESSESDETTEDAIKKYYGIEKIEIESVKKVYDYLEFENGNTGDNYQIGIRPDGSAAAYDYGFISGKYDMCVSNSLGSVVFRDYYRPLAMVESMLIKRSNKLTFYQE